MALFGTWKEEIRARRAELLWWDVKRVAGIGWAPEDFSGL